MLLAVRTKAPITLRAQPRGRVVLRQHRVRLSEPSSDSANQKGPARVSTVVERARSAPIAAPDVRFGVRSPCHERTASSRTWRARGTDGSRLIARGVALAAEHPPIVRRGRHRDQVSVRLSSAAASYEAAVNVRPRPCPSGSHTRTPAACRPGHGAAGASRSCHVTFRRGRRTRRAHRGRYAAPRRE